MSERPDHDTAERGFRDLLRRQGLPEPDEVARWRDCLVFGWNDTKALVVVDLDEFDPDDLRPVPLEPDDLGAIPLDGPIRTG